MTAPRTKKKKLTEVELVAMALRAISAPGTWDEQEREEWMIEARAFLRALRSGR